MVFVEPPYTLTTAFMYSASRRSADLPRASVAASPPHTAVVQLRRCGSHRVRNKTHHTHTHSRRSKGRVVAICAACRLLTNACDCIKLSAHTRALVCVYVDACTNTRARKPSSVVSAASRSSAAADVRVVCQNPGRSSYI